jgi:hypothetical protein
MTKVAKLDDERRRREELSCRHVTAVLETFRYSLDQLNPASRDEARRHVRSEIKRLFEG